MIEIRKEIIIVALVVGLAFWFYWFQYRPAKIRHDCFRQATEGVPITREQYKVFYEACLHDKGLE